jgi:hypothetical protein
MLSSCANYTTSNQNSQSDYHSHSRSSSLPVFTSDTNLLPNDDLFLIKYNDNIIVSPTNISNTSSPSKYRVLNTPERVGK